MTFATSGNSPTTSTNTLIPHSATSSPIHAKEPLLPKRKAVTSVIAAASATRPSGSNIFTALQPRLAIKYLRRFKIVLLRCYRRHQFGHHYLPIQRILP